MEELKCENHIFKTMVFENPTCINCANINICKNLETISYCYEEYLKAEGGDLFGDKNKLSD